MKVIVDKLQSPPPHALTIPEVKALFARVPAEWDLWLRVVHLKATLPENSRFDRPVIYQVLGGPCLNVCSRGLGPHQARKEILRELAIQGLRKPLRMTHRLSAAETQELDRIIAPILALVDQDSSGREPAPAPRPKHRVYPVLEEAGYSWKEAYQVLRSIEEERRHPTSRRKANRIVRAEQVLRDAGIDPNSLLLGEDS